MNANTIRLTEQRDEAQSQVRSLETDVRLLRAALDEAVARLRRLHGTITCVHHGNGVSIVNTSATEGTSDSPQKVIYLETGAFSPASTRPTRE